MNSRTRNALELSIEKWTGYCNIGSDEEFDEIELGVNNCPLCLLFWDQRCCECPVYEHTRMTRCAGTPYERANHWIDNFDLEKFKEAAIKEVEFLKSLRTWPKDQRQLEMDFKMPDKLCKDL